MSETAAILLGGAIGITAAVPVIFFTARRLARRAVSPLGSPPCDRCGKPTGKPYLWADARSRWHCAACENWITSQLFRSLADGGPIPRSEP